MFCLAKTENISLKAALKYTVLWLIQCKVNFTCIIIKLLNYSLLTTFLYFIISLCKNRTWCKFGFMYIYILHLVNLFKNQTQYLYISIFQYCWRLNLQPLFSSYSFLDVNFDANIFIIGEKEPSNYSSRIFWLTFVMSWLLPVCLATLKYMRATIDLCTIKMQCKSHLELNDIFHSPAKGSKTRKSVQVDATESSSVSVCLFSPVWVRFTKRS